MISATVTRTTINMGTAACGASAAPQWQHGEHLLLLGPGLRSGRMHEVRGTGKGTEVGRGTSWWFPWPVCWQSSRFPSAAAPLLHRLLRIGDTVLRLLPLPAEGPMAEGGRLGPHLLAGSAETSER